VATVWITYAWLDNKHSDVDYVAQELKGVGLEVKLDRLNIVAGRRLWEQIENFIQNPDESDAWILYATTNSLGSEACREEYAYALDRAINVRGKTFPIIGLFPGVVDNSLIPAGIRTRLYVSLQDSDWKERIKAAAEGRSPEIQAPNVTPYHIELHKLDPSYGRKFAVELRPRADSWSPCVVGIPLNEKKSVNPSILHGSSGLPPHNGMLFLSGEAESDDGEWWMMWAQNEATPKQSYYLFCDILPSRIGFGDKNKPPQKTSIHQFYTI